MKLKSIYTYQKERFPILLNLILIGIFTFSAMSFSRNLRDVEDTINWQTYIAGLVVTFTTFLLIRIIDEFKDYEVDKKHRPHLPVQRGIISLKTLRTIGIVVFIVQVATFSYFIPNLWPFYLLVIGYLFFMSFEFFIHDWLSKKTILYTTSHMFIVALIDLFASSLDWYNLKQEAPYGLYILIIASFFNGMVIEFGRKIKAKENEEFNSYTKIYGIKKTVLIWISMTFLTLVAAIVACLFAKYHYSSILVLGLFFVINCLVGFNFIQNPTIKRSKRIEISSGIWTMVMYLIVGCYAQIEQGLSYIL